MAWGQGTLTNTALRSWLEDRAADLSEAGGEALPWALGETTIVSLTTEASRRAGEALLPDSVSWPIPCYARVIAVRCSDSPVGAFDLALLTVGARLGGMPRDWVVDALGSGGVLQHSGDLGLPVRPGEVTITSGDAGRHATVVGDDTGVLVTITQGQLQAMDPLMIRYDPFTFPVERGGSVALESARFEPTVEDGARDWHCDVSVGAGGTSNSLWQVLRPADVITSTLASCSSARLIRPDGG